MRMIKRRIRKSAAPVQTEWLQVRLLIGEKRALKEAASAEGLTISEFTRRALAQAVETRSLLGVAG